MKEIWRGMQLLFALIGAWIGRFIGGLDGRLYALIVLVCVDYVTGVLSPVIRHELSSSAGFRGLLKKMAVFILVGLANVVDMSVFASPGVLRMTVIFYYISNEGISILENYAEMGMPVPDKLREVLAQIREHGIGADDHSKTE
ncbi:MAG: phage holin family protein [Clostridia bacterium]|nr:phage holin family protein [Clostridia bacterium]